jgi:polyhydroxyalkanoate synthesis regulator phasin
VSSCQEELKNYVSTVKNDMKTEMSAGQEKIENDISVMKNDLKTGISAVKWDIIAMKTKINAG